MAYRCIGCEHFHSLHCYYTTVHIKIEASFTSSYYNTNTAIHICRHCWNMHASFLRNTRTEPMCKAPYLLEMIAKTSILPAWAVWVLLLLAVYPIAFAQTTVGPGPLSMDYGDPTANCTLSECATVSATQVGVSLYTGKTPNGIRFTLRPKDSSGLNTAMFTTSNSFDINDQSDKNAIWNYFTSDVSQSRVVDAYIYATLSFTNTTTIHINSVNNSAQENCLIRMPMTTAV